MGYRKLLRNRTLLQKGVDMINFLIAVGVLVVLAVLVSTLAKIGKFGNNPRTGTIFFTYKDKTFALRRAKNK